MRFERDKLMRDRPAYSIRDRGYGLDQSPDLWLQSLPAYRHQLNAWQNGGDHLCSLDSEQPEQHASKRTLDARDHQASLNRRFHHVLEPKPQLTQVAALDW